MKKYTTEELKQERELMEQLKQFDTPTVTNAVATYPKNKETCLGLYHPWEGEWYTDQTLKCMYPELGRVVGYAVMILNPFAALVSLNYMGTPVFDALGTLLTPLWLKVCAPEDLKPYEDMLGRVLTPEQLEEKRLELGLVKRKAKL